ncbi:ABC transporter permease [Clostridium paraputrificum]|uniref:ABC transporter permease n=1 Tax=Clostridium paraputrificum TaxID=29363 RepID=UPI003D353B0E
MKLFKTMLKTQLKLAIREIDGILFGILFPIGIVLLLGFIYGDKPAFDGANFTMIQLSFGAFISVGICATGLMGLPLSISDFRSKKILKGLKVTPISPINILMIQMLIGFIISVISALAVFIVAKFLFGYVMIGSGMKFIPTFILVTTAIYSIGMLIASLVPNIKVANLVCTLVYFPMVFLSGATIPYEIFPKGLQVVADIMPLTQGIKLMKGVSLGEPLNNIAIQLILMIAISIVCITVSIKTFKWE